MELYFTANKIKADKRVLVFLNVIGRENYSLLRSILALQKTRGAAPKEAHGYHEGVLRTQEGSHGSEVSFSPTSATAWGVRSHILGKITKVGDARVRESLDEALRDRLVCGLHDEAY